MTTDEPTFEQLVAAARRLVGDPLLLLETRLELELCRQGGEDVELNARRIAAIDVALGEHPAPKLLTFPTGRREAEGDQPA